MPFPNWDAVRVQAPVPLVMVTVPPLIEHTPLAVMVTGRPELAEAETAKVVL